MRGRGHTTSRAVLLAFVGLVASAVAGAATPVTASADTSVTAIVFPSSVSVTPQSPTTLHVELTNTSAESLSAMSAVVHLTEQPLTTIAETSSWFHDPGVDVGITDSVEQVDIADLAPGESGSTSIEIALSDRIAGDSWGVIGVSVVIASAGATVADARTALVWQPTEIPAQATFATILPLVAPPTAASLLSTDDLDAWMRPGGVLSTQLTESPHASAVAVDPRLIASVLRWGDKAPASARDWLAQLRSSTVPSLRLQFADADAALEGQVGFGQLVNADYTDMSSVSRQNLDEVWGPSIPQSVWAEPSTLTAGALTTILAGMTEEQRAALHLIAGSSNLADTQSPHVTVAATLPSGETTTVDALVTNDAFTQSIRAAERATSDAAWTAAATEAASYLGVAAASGGEMLVGGFSRTVDATTLSRAGATMTYLGALPWASQTTLDVALSSPAQPVALVDTPESTERLSGGAVAFANFEALSEFSTATSSPDKVLSYAGRHVMPVLSVSWFGSATTWPEAQAELNADTAAYFNDVHFGLTSNINMVGGQASIPFTIVNAHPFDVTVVVHAVPSNPRLTVGDAQVVTIPAESQGTVKVPVAARVGNGDVDLTLTLSTSSGRVLGSAVVVPVSVRADWEGFGLGIIAVAFVALVSTGIVRTIRRRGRTQGRSDETTNS